MTATTYQCHNCGSENLLLTVYDGQGDLRYVCNNCGVMGPPTARALKKKWLKWKPSLATGKFLSALVISFFSGILLSLGSYNNRFSVIISFVIGLLVLYFEYKYKWQEMNITALLLVITFAFVGYYIALKVHDYATLLRRHKTDSSAPDGTSFPDCVRSTCSELPATEATATQTISISTTDTLNPSQPPLPAISTATPTETPVFIKPYISTNTFIPLLITTVILTNTPVPTLSETSYPQGTIIPTLTNTISPVDTLTPTLAELPVPTDTSTVVATNTIVLTETSAPASTEMPESTATVTLTLRGCGPGYWKTHHKSWIITGFNISDDFDTVFEVNLFESDITLEQALDLQGGGAERLARQGVAALLNASHPDVGYSLTVEQVNSLLQLGDADSLSLYNESVCPLK